MIRGVIKVVDDLSSVDTSKYDSSLPSSNSGPSCCAVPINDSENYPDTLITTSKVTEEFQTAIINVVNDQFQPLILIAKNNLNFNLTLDFSNYNNSDGEYTIYNLKDKSIIKTFNGQKSIFEIQLNFSSSGGYAITKNSEILGIIEVVDNMDNIDFDEVLKKYISSY